MTEWAGIDLRGRTMLHPPCRTGRTAIDRFPCFSEVIIDTVSAFAESGGSVDELVDLLNQHFPPDAEKLNNNDILNPKNSYSHEFQFYTVQFTKLLLDDLLFCFKTDNDGQLSIHHLIYEKGRIDMPPWIVADGGANDGYMSITNLSATIFYLEEKYTCSYIDTDRIELGHRLSGEFVTFLNKCVPDKYQVDRAFFEKEGVLISYEYLSFGGEIIRALTNETRIIKDSYYYGFFHHNQLARAIFLQPELSLVEGFLEWQRRTNDIHRMEFRTARRTLWIKLNFRPLVQTGLFGRYRKSMLSRIHEGAPSIYQVFLELATGKKVKTKLIFDKTDDLSLTVRLHWRPPHSSYFTTIASVLAVLIVMAAVITGQVFLPQKISFPLISAILALITGIATVAALNWRNKLKATRNRFISSRDVIDKQLISLKETTNELLSERDLLDKKVGERTSELNEALKQLKELDRSKTNFIANVSHELRTPLTLISVPLEGIKSGRYGENVSADHEVFKLVERNVKRLNNQINQLLDFARLDLGTMRFEPESINILEYCRMLVAELDSIAERKHLSLEIENNTGKEAIFISADKFLMETAVLNLINNALKFTEIGGIKVILSLHADDNIELTVKDSGIGFSPEQKDRLFQRFTQVEDQKVRHREGCGIGLALVDEIAGIHGWTIEAEGHTGEGSSFSLIMPLQTEGCSIELRDSPIFDERESMHDKVESALVFPVSETISICSEGKDIILLVEDNPDMGAVLNNLLCEEYELHWCTGGSEALSWLETSPQLSLIICDVMMPKMSGFTFREELRINSDYINIPFIYLTALADVEDKVEGLKSGAVDYIQKPFTVVELTQKVKNLVNSHKASYMQALKDSRGAERLNRILINTENEHSVPNWQTLGITRSEQRIVELVRQGMQDKEIAAELSISPRTVSSHLSHLYQKTDTQNRTELINLLYQHT